MLVCQQGKFIFKNGRVYEGIFENDHIREFPDFAMDGINTPDLSAIRTRTPLCAGKDVQFQLRRLAPRFIHSHSDATCIFVCAFLGNCHVENFRQPC